MKHVLYFSVALMLAGCDMELDPEKTAANPNDNSPVIFPGGSASSPYYSLRPADDKWPGFVDENNLSANLLTANYYIVLDGSGSMDGDNCAEGSTKMVIAKNTINQFAQQIPADANLALLAFDLQGASQRVALGTNNREQFNLQVNAISAAGITPLKTAITYAYQKLKAQAVTQMGYGEYHLVVVTDGIANSGEGPDQIVQSILQESPVVIHSVGFCIDERHSLNQPGRTFYTAASNAEELQRGLQDVLAESPDFSSDIFTQ